jgi:O-antigen ligase
VRQHSAAVVSYAAPMSRYSVIWLSIALVWTTATQLRPDQMPIGLGELMLIAWIAYALHRSFVVERGQQPLGLLPAVALVFWTLQAAFLAAGTIARQTMGIDDYGSASHDAVALMLSTAFCVALSLRMQQAGVARYATAWLAITTGVASGSLLVAALFVDRLGPIELWYALVRFRGWAANPNQLALLVAVAPFACLHFAAESNRKDLRWFFRACAALSLAAGVMTASDALLVGWVSAGTLFVVARFKDTLFEGARSVGTLIAVGVLLPALVVTIVAIYGGAIYSAAADVFLGMYSLGDQGSVRFTVWQNAIGAYLHSPLVGFGPGAYSGRLGSFAGYEAHNTVLDWAMSTGALGVGVLLLLVGFIVVQIMRSRKRMLLLALASLLVFSLFHYMIRQPLFWAWLFLLYQLALDEAPTTGETGSDSRTLAPSLAG